ncbi:PucR family transcriptional regulator [Nocardioides donggukensis]|uniref:PucR family transcriptional regulator ligand-binding domain-containing protein n=1 Tax=Nocardioides donggukensis TaxID=2774019 RepID=A0A927K725_9ACTN|nr:PucR family transcriptional regulator [Nocardioides donggukensis]MBD8870203.1 PucR family transcriptional regulator ligand-binding domain-containing protein [Nocardioides donggukensis]
MLVPLAEILALPEVAAAAPHVVAGDASTCEVRWVHSSEVFEMGPLLKGGEFLLTTGLGLRGASSPDLEAYVDAMADAGLAAIGLELGRTFAEFPEALVRAARRRHVPLVEFREVVPFEDVVEAFHELVKDREAGGLWRGERIWRDLLDVVLEGRGVQALVQRIADLAECPAVLRALDGRVVATSAGVVDGQAEEHGSSRRVHLDGAPWGTLGLAGAPTQLAGAVLDRAPRAVSLELLRTGTSQDRLALSSGLLREILHHRFPTAEELRSRCEVAGFPVASGRPVLAIAVAGDRRMPRRALAAAAAEAGRATFGSCLAGEVDQEVVLAVHAPAGGEPALRDRLDRLAARLSEGIERATGHTIVATGAGSVVAGVEELARSIGQAREVVTIARRLGTHRATLLARDLGIYRLLAHFQTEPELSVFLREQLGPLLDHDAAHGTELVRTLDAYLRHGLVKSETAASLGIRRQSLYNRLHRIDTVLGGETVGDHDRLTALSLALHAWRLRTGLDPGQG